MTTERDWRRAYAEASGDHRSYVERYGKSQQPVVSPDPRDAVIAELCGSLETLRAYAAGMIADGLPHSSTLPSAVARASAALRRARGEG